SPACARGKLRGAKVHGGGDRGVRSLVPQKPGRGSLISVAAGWLPARVRAGRDCLPSQREHASGTLSRGLSTWFLVGAVIQGAPHARTWTSPAPSWRLP